MRSARSCTSSDSRPSRLLRAARAARSEVAAMRSATASAWARSSLSLRNARCENSPASARRAPAVTAAAMTCSSTTGEPCSWSSRTCSPVNDAGASKYSASPSSSTRSSASTTRARIARRGRGQRPISRSASAGTNGPDRRTMPTPPGPGGVAIAQMVSVIGGRRAPRASGPGPRFLGVDLAKDVPLLAQRDTTVGRPVQHQPGREESEQDGERDRQPLHDLALHRIHPGHRRQSLGHDHEYAVDDRQDEQRIGLAEVRHPEEAGLAQFDRLQQHPVKRDEDRNLDQDRKTAAKRVDLLLLVDLHHRLAELLAIIAVAFLQLLDARLQLAQLAHRTELRLRQLVERQLDQQGEQDDRYAPVADQGMDLVEQPEQRLGEHGEDAVIDGQAEPVGDFVEAVLFLRPGEQFGFETLRGAGLDPDRRRSRRQREPVRHHRIDEAGRIPMRDLGGRNPCAEEVVLDHAGPATLEGIAVWLVGELIEWQLDEF